MRPRRAIVSPLVGLVGLVPRMAARPEAADGLLVDTGVELPRGRP